MRYNNYYEAVEVEYKNGEPVTTFSVEYVFKDVRYAADGVANGVSDAYARIREHRQEFRKELAAKRDRITDTQQTEQIEHFTNL